MTESARKRAEAALVLARHKETAPAEREAALAGALRIIKAAGLDLDDFDIPGRERKRPSQPQPSRYRDDLFERPRSPFYSGTWTQGDLDEVLDLFRRHMRSAWDREAESAARSSATPAAVNRERADDAVKHLWARGVKVYQASPGPYGDRLWIIPDDSSLEYDDDGIIEVAARYGWPVDPVKQFEGAVAFLRKRGIEVTPVAPGLWHCQGADVAARVIVLAAQLRGFER